MKEPGRSRAEPSERLGMAHAGGAPGVQAALGAPGGAAGLSSQGLSTPAAQQQPQLVFAASRQPRMSSTHTCTSLEDIWAIPPPSRRPWRRSAPGPAPEVTQRDKRALGPPQP